MTQPIDAVLAPLEFYARGHATGDAGHLRQAFLPTAHIDGLRDGEFTSWGLETYCARFDGTPAVNEEECRRTVDHVQVQGSIATATMTLDHGSAVFTDMFVLIDGPSGWRPCRRHALPAPLGRSRRQPPRTLPRRGMGPGEPVQGSASTPSSTRHRTEQHGLVAQQGQVADRLTTVGESTAKSVKTPPGSWPPPCEPPCEPTPRPSAPTSIFGLRVVTCTYGAPSRSSSAGPSTSPEPQQDRHFRARCSALGAPPTQERSGGR